MRKPELSFSHVGLFVRDIARMADFYTRLLGFSVSDRGQMGKTSFVFLTRDPREHHQIVLASGRPEELAFNAINQISFRMRLRRAARDVSRGPGRGGRDRDRAGVARQRALG